MLNKHPKNKKETLLVKEMKEIKNQTTKNKSKQKEN